MMCMNKIKNIINYTNALCRDSAKNFLFFKFLLKCPLPVFRRHIMFCLLPCREIRNKIEIIILCKNSKSGQSIISETEKNSPPPMMLVQFYVYINKFSSLFLPPIALWYV